MILPVEGDCMERGRGQSLPSERFGCVSPPQAAHRTPSVSMAGPTNNPSFVEFRKQLGEIADGRKRILALDGGGRRSAHRGAANAAPREADAPERLVLIGSTSTGAIIAAALYGGGISKAF